jgi:predicted outer membrane repeat protein
MNTTSRATFGRPLLCAVLIAALMLSSFAGAPARAATNAIRYVSPTGVDSIVTNCLSAPCRTISFAIGRAAAGDTINVAAGTYNENVNIAKSITLQGAGPDVTIVDGSGIGNVFYIFGTGTNVTLTGLTIRNGAATGIYLFGGGIYYESNGQLFVSAANIISNTAFSGGGGIFSQGQLTLNTVNILNNSSGAQGGGGLRINGVANLTNVTVANNRTATFGGGIFNLGTMQLAGVTIANNVADSGGGGLYNKGGTIVGNSGEIRSNQAGINGGGIYNELVSAQLNLSNMTIKDNTAPNSLGGGVYNDQGTASFIKVILSGNIAKGSGGGIHNTAGGSLTITQSWLKANVAQTTNGGGIYNEGTLDMTASTLSDNTAPSDQGGGLRNKGNATLTLVTLSGNTASGSGGGAIYTDGGAVQIVSSTIVRNTDPGLKAAAPGTLSLANSIVVDRSGGQNCSGPITSQGYNLETKNSCNFTQPGDQINKSSPGVGLLKDNGGPTPTHAIAFSSPATNNGTTDSDKCQSADQRGIRRPQPENGRCDIGAYEVVGFENNTTEAIPANGCITSTIAINDSYSIGALNVGVNATITSRASLRITLISPAGRRVALLGPTVGTGVNLDAMFDDEASSGVPGDGTNDTGSPYYDNLYRPYDLLSVLKNAAIKGTWKLEACSVTSQTGLLNSWLILVPDITTSFKVYLPLIRR